MIGSCISHITPSLAFHDFDCWLSIMNIFTSLVLNLYVKALQTVMYALIVNIICNSGIEFMPIKPLNFELGYILPKQILLNCVWCTHKVNKIILNEI